MLKKECCFVVLPLGQRVEVAALIEVVEDGLDVWRHDLLALPVVLPQQSVVLHVGYHLVLLQLAVAVVPVLMDALQVGPKLCYGGCVSHATYLFVTALYLRPKTRPIPALSTILMVLKAVMLYRQLFPLELLPISRIRVGQTIMAVWTV